MSFIFNICLFAQAPDTLWTLSLRGHTIVDLFVQQTTDNGYIASGYLFGQSNSIWLLKANANGDTLWSKSFDTRSSGVYLGEYRSEKHIVQETLDRGFIVVGEYNISSDETYNFDIWIIKTDENGDTLWTKTYGGSEYDMANSVHLTRDGGFIIAGNTKSFGAGEGDVWLIKTDAHGDTLWTKTIGGNNEDWGSSVQQTKDGGYIIKGSSQGPTNNAGEKWLIKTDNLGNTVWKKSFTEKYTDWNSSLQQTTNGDYIMVGSIYDSIDGISGGVSLIKTNSLGDLILEKRLGESGDWGNSVQQSNDDGYIICGFKAPYSASDSDVLLMKTDMNGHVLWTTTYSSSENEYAISIQQTNDEGFIIACEIYSFSSVESGILLIKTAPDAMGIKETNLQNGTFNLNPNYPNPFQSKTTFEYNLPGSGKVKIAVYDIFGREIDLLVDEKKNAGQHEIEWDATGFPSGMYLCRMFLNERPIETRKMILKK